MSEDESADTESIDGVVKTKQCPFCAEDIKAEAKKCKICGEYLVERVFKEPPPPEAPSAEEEPPPLPPEPEPEKSASPPLFPILFLVLFAAFVVYAARRPTNPDVFGWPPEAGTSARPTASPRP